MDPDHQSALLQRTQTAIRRYEALRSAMGRTNRSFARSEIHSYGHWSPLESLSDAMTMAEVSPVASCAANPPRWGTLSIASFRWRNRRPSWMWDSADARRSGRR